MTTPAPSAKDFERAGEVLGAINSIIGERLADRLSAGRTVIAQALVCERERAAKIADRWTAADVLIAGVDTGEAREIAAAIRAGDAA